jgi:hypothetical protein
MSSRMVATIFSRTTTAEPAGIRTWRDYLAARY